MSNFGFALNAVNSFMNGGYDDYYRSANEFSDGLYGRTVNNLPIVKDIANMYSDISKTNDYMSNNGLSWSDIHSYNANSIGANSGLNPASIASQTSWLGNIGSDLGKLYSGQKSR